MRMNGRNVVRAAVVVIVIAVAVLLALQLLTRGRVDKAMTIDPALEREITEQDRAILKTRINAIFPKWAQAWKSGNFRFDPSALQRDSIEEIDSSLITRVDEVNVPLDDESLRKLVSPDGMKYLEFTGDAEAEPDSELTLVDAARNERQRLLFYGPSVRFDDAAWVDAGTVVVVGEGTEGGESEADSVQPLVWIFHLPHRLVSTYSVSAH